jgi:hypothetical protein
MPQRSSRRRKEEAFMSGNTTHPIPEKFPVISCPTTFADGVLNATIAPGIVKFYLFRHEPSLQSDNQFQTQPVGQVVMPTDGFVGAVLYLNLQLERLIEGEFITRERVEHLRALVEQGS